jgi:hypothetical protein
MLDGALPGSRDLSANPRNRINCALADNDAETNMKATQLNPARFHSALPAFHPLPKA